MNHPTESTYRDHFAQRDKAVDYDQQQYAPGSYGDILWRVEQMQLQMLIEEFRRTHSHIDYLDFACGTGRIISFMQDKVDTVTGIEISESMAQLGRDKLQKGTIHCRDITPADAPIEGKYDLITAFRFVLNAEPALRVAGMKALAARLRDDTSWLVFNNHGNLWSHKLFMWPVHAMRSIGKEYRPEGNYLTHSQVLRLVDEVSLKVERVLGCGVIGGKLAQMMDMEKVAARERKLANTFLTRFGVNQMYVARRK